jgi:hypothetical protein
MRRRGAWAAALLLFAVAACGRSADGTPAELPTPAITSVSAPDSEIVAERFLEAWKMQDYAAMYAELSPLTQDAIRLEDFEKRYTDVWRAAALTGLDYEVVSSLVNPQAPKTIGASPGAKRESFLSSSAAIRCTQTT